MELGILLTRLRRGRRMSQEDLAHASGVSVRTIRNLEHGTVRPLLATVRALAVGLRLDDEERRHLETVVGAVGGGAVGTLPAPPNRLVGRQSELAALVRLVRRARMVTVTGPGGVGKSRLAVEAAWHLVDRFERIDVIDLGPLRGRDEVLGELAATAEVGSAATAAAIAARIGEDSRLLVLDGVEHVPDIGSDLATLLAHCPQLHLLMTGRAPVPVDGTVWTLDPFPLPPATTDPAQALTSPAVELLVERARAVRPDFTLDDSTVEDAIAICRRLDGLPLAIELAAGQLGDQDLVRLARQLTVRNLRTDLVDVPPRHRTLMDTVAWSVALLGDPERLVFRVLGAFRGRVLVEALAAVMAVDATELVTGSLPRLAAASLLRISPDESTTVDLLDTIREVARADLEAAGLADRYGHAHAEHMLGVVRSGDRAATDRQLDDIRAAVEFACARAADLLDRTVVTGLADHLTLRGRFAEAHRLLAAIAAAAVDRDAAGSAWLRAGIAANHHGDHRAALACGQAAAQQGVSGLAVAARNLIGAAHKSLGDLTLAHEAYLACLLEAEAAGETRYVTVALNNLGTVAHDRGDLDTARDYYQRSLDIKTTLGDERGIATALVNLGGLDHDAARSASAIGPLTQALARFRQLGEPHAVVFTLALLANARLALGDLPAATQDADEAARLAVDIDNGPVRAMVGQACGDLARIRGDLAAAASHYTQALAHGPEPFERARLLDRLAAVLTADPQRAAAAADEAAQIRRRNGFAVPPVDLPLLRRPGDGGSSAPGR